MGASRELVVGVVKSCPAFSGYRFHRYGKGFGDALLDWLMHSPEAIPKGQRDLHRSYGRMGVFVSHINFLVIARAC